MSVADESLPQVAVTVTWKLKNISHRKISATENAEHDIVNILRDYVAKETSAFLLNSSASVEVTLRTPLADDLDQGLELLEQLDPELRPLLIEWAEDIKGLIRTGQEPPSTSLLGQAIAGLESNRSAQHQNGGHRLLTSHDSSSGFYDPKKNQDKRAKNWEVRHKQCIHAQEQLGAAIFNLVFAMFGVSSRYASVIARRSKKLQPASGWHDIQVLLSSKKIVDKVKGIIKFLTPIFTGTGLAVMATVFKEELPTWQYITNGISVLATFASWALTGFTSLYALLIKLASSLTGVTLASINCAKLCANLRRLGDAPSLGSDAESASFDEDPGATNLMSYADARIVMGPVSKGVADHLINGFNTGSLCSEEGVAKHLEAWPIVKLVQDGVTSVLATQPAQIAAMCITAVCLPGFELDPAKSKVLCKDRNMCTPLDDTQRCCKLTQGASNELAPGQLMKFDLTINIDYDNIKREGDVVVSQLQGLMQQCVVEESGKLVQTAAVDAVLSPEAAQAFAHTRLSVTVESSGVRQPQRLISTIASDGCFKVKHCMVNSLMARPDFEQLRHSGFDFVDARVVRSPEFLPPPHRRLIVLT
jgi:hypothetical protein